MQLLSTCRIAALAALAFTAASADALTYVAARGVGTGMVNLSITTDGTIGALGDANIVGWSITVAEGGDSFTLMPGNSQSSMSGGVSATATDLWFDFDNAGIWLIQTPVIGSGQPFWCVQGNFGCFDFDGPAEGILANFGGFSFVRQAYAGRQIIASVADGAVPEPGSWALMIAGFGLIGLAMRRRSSVTA